MNLRRLFDNRRRYGWSDFRADARAVCGHKPAAPPTVFARASRAIDPERYVESVRAYFLTLPDGHAFPSGAPFSLRATHVPRNASRVKRKIPFKDIFGVIL